MTTAQTDRGRASRQRILDTASDLFYRQGVAATGLNEILAASGAGKGQLYHYFTDKPDLVLAVAAAQADRVLAAQQQLLDDMADAADLRGWVDQAVAVHEQGGPVRCPLGALALELGDRHPGLRARLQTGFAAWRAGLAAALDRLQRGGHVRADRDPGDLAEILLCAYEGGVLMSEVHAGTHSLRLALDSAVEAMVTGGSTAG